MSSRRASVAFVGLCLMVVLSASLTLGQGASAPGVPKIVIEKTEFNAGEVKEGEGVKHSFTFRNAGTGILEIKRVVLTCGCETVDYDKSVEPGKDGKITLLVRTAGLGGALSKLVVASTNDPSRPSIDLVMHLTVISETRKVTGETVGAFLLSPSNVLVRTVPVGTAADFAVTIYGAGAGVPPPKITKVVSESPKFSAILEPASDGSRFVVRVTSATDLPVGRHPHTVKLMTESKENPEVELKLEAIVTLPLRISPKSLSFDRVASLDGLPPTLSKFIWVMQSGGPALEIKGVQSTLPFLTAERTENGSPGTTILRILFTAIPPKGSHSGKIVVLTNIAAQPQFEFDVTVNVP
ncbi:MAG: DUF1573 domain-containing protein [Acidobacteriota bacterium]